MEYALKFPIIYNKPIHLWRILEGCHQICFNNFENPEPFKPLNRFIITYDQRYSWSKFEPIPIELEYDPKTFAFKEHSIGFVFEPAKIRVCLIILPPDDSKKRGYPVLNFTTFGGEFKRFINDDNDDDWRNDNRPIKPKIRPVCILN